jgi:hypothetical protein
MLTTLPQPTPLHAVDPVESPSGSALNRAFHVGSHAEPVVEVMLCSMPVSEASESFTVLFGGRQKLCVCSIYTVARVKLIGRAARPFESFWQESRRVRGRL